MAFTTSTHPGLVFFSCFVDCCKGILKTAFILYSFFHFFLFLFFLFIFHIFFFSFSALTATALINSHFGYSPCIALQGSTCWGHMLSDLLACSVGCGIELKSWVEKSQVGRLVVEYVCYVLEFERRFVHKMAPSVFRRLP